ncbi:MAG TPA: hypothetical protein PLS29_08440, partial [Acidimicrobiales bacterium]|nr:hypothetical protein [Acidimicrobiales bacterium]
MRRRVLLNVGVPILSLVLVLVVWQLIVVGFHVASYIAPRPLGAITSVTSQWSSLWPLILGTIRETIYGYVIGAVLGFALGVAMAKTPFVQRLVYPVILVSQAVPVIALAPVLVIILGFGIVPKI